MSIVFIGGILIVIAFAMSSYFSVKSHEKHDRVLFAFCQIRRDLMAELREQFDSLSQQEYESAKFLLDTLNKVIRHYRSHKTFMFNLRKAHRVIKKDLRRYHAVQKRIHDRLSKVPPDTKIAKLYGDFSRAVMVGFLTYTPFILSEIVLRLLWAESSKQVAEIRRQQHEISGEKFA